jgi:hypothetical protein
MLREIGSDFGVSIVSREKELRNRTTPDRLRSKARFSKTQFAKIFDDIGYLIEAERASGRHLKTCSHLGSCD